jgi:hypothetical protein
MDVVHLSRRTRRLHYLALGGCIFVSASVCHAADAPNIESQIKAAASSSSCAQYSWKERGKAPAGFITGIALVYANAYRDLKHNIDPTATIVAGDAKIKSSDALELYGKTAGPSRLRLRATYALAIGEGMRESSGNTTEGYDVTARDQTEETAEAGLFQISHDSIGSSPWLQAIETKFASRPDLCLLEAFMQGVPDKKATVLGNGPAAAFQRRMKSCPAFATEYAVIMFRVNRSHFGPIKRHEAELLPACEAMFEHIEQIVDSSGS